MKDNPSHNLPQLVALLATSLASRSSIDKAVIEALPENTTPLSVEAFGTSMWSVTAKLNTVDEQGNQAAFFLKYVPGDLGRTQLDGEFVGMTELYKVAPGFVPRPIGWGRLIAMEIPSYFLLVEFKYFTTSLPDNVKLGTRVAALHKNSLSPTGMFGFPVRTFDGARVQAVSFNPSWTSFFSKLLAEAYRQDTETNGLWPELDLAYRQVQSDLIPRLIGVLEKDGRKVKPVLIHGDMWDGNIGTDSSTGDPWIFDCAAYYAHNEMDLGIWRAERHHLRDKVYRNEYLRHMAPSEPKDEFDDRNLLYSAKTNFMHSACFKESPARPLVLSDFVYLLQKYVPRVLAKKTVDKSACI